MHVREAVIADYQAVRNLLHDSDAYHARHVPAVARVPDEPRFTRDELTELLANANCLVLVAEHEGMVVGFIEASIRVPERPDEVTMPWCGINNLAVDDRWRRRGIGSALVEAAEAWARRKGLMQVRLEVFEFNSGARTLYERLGYRTISRHMGKPLS
ncbi:MAG: GNAT family N-acetyltransferase [Chloroflexota bacterium]|nr:GNAT family N-acetyltransferase [Chloroflexota bacterium]